MLLKSKQSFNAESVLGGTKATISLDSKIYKIELKDKAECSNACPAGVNVKAYVNLIANRRFEEAVDVIRQNNPFPAICGRVCTRPCEESCEQAESGDSVSIRALKRYASDYEIARRALKSEPCKVVFKEKIAIIGSGPAGLSAAVDLVRFGYPITVFEAENEPGGMLRYAIPPYRLPKRILKREIDWIKDLGVKVLTGEKINDSSKLLKKGFSAAIIAQGAPKSLALNILGDDSEGVIDPLLFLKTVNTNNPMKIKGEVVVIGGGSTAFDVARSSIRLGVKNVTIAYRRSIKEMPAEKEEIIDAEAEGVNITTLVIPNKIIVKKGKVSGIEFLKAELGKVDESGRRRPIPIKDSEFVINADFVIPAIGAKPDVQNIKIIDNKGRIKTDNNAKTEISGIFAAGDVELGPSSVVEAIGRGHIAANSIHRFFRQIKLSKKDNPIPIVIDSKTCSNCLHAPKRIEEKDMKTTFNEVEKPYSDFEAVEEASRCFTCGPCHMCKICVPNCDHKQLIAKVDDSDFLLKVPCDLSLKITEKGPKDLKMQVKGKTKDIRLQSLTAKVEKELCIGCGRCEELCSYRAISNIVSKAQKTIAEVDHDACASCGACVSACPTGAISQGYMSDDKILLRFGEIQSKGGIKALMSYWNTPTHFFGEINATTELMSVRKTTASFLIRALARSKKGLILIGPDEKTGSHYLPSDEDSEETVKNAQNLLKLVGISPNRIKYKAVGLNTDPSNILEKYSKSLKKHNYLNIPIPKIKMNPLGETISLLRIMWANADNIPIDDYCSLSKATTNGIALFEGCTPMLHMIGKTHNLFDLSSTRQSIFDLLEKTKIKCGIIPDLSCPATGLLKIKIKGAEEIVEKISLKNQKAINKIKPKKLIITTPEAFNTFSKENEKITALPDELYNLLKKSKKLNPIKTTLAIHNSCNMQKDPFFDSTKNLLKLIPGLKIVEINDKCGHLGFDKIDSISKDSALKLFKKAEKVGANKIICTSPYCQSHLLLCKREGSWRSSDIEIIDPYSIIIASLNGGNI